MQLSIKDPQIQLDQQQLAIGGELLLTAGQRTVITGASGSGKSCLLQAMCGLKPLASGTLLWQQKPVTAHNIHQLRQQVGWLPQYPWLGEATVKEALSEACQIAGKAFNPNETNELMQLLLLAQTLLDQPCKKLSGGQKSRFALLRLLLIGKQLILADEPTASLDSSATSALISLQQLKKYQHIGWLSISHDQQWIEAQTNHFQLQDQKLIALRGDQ